MTFVAMSQPMAMRTNVKLIWMKTLIILKKVSASLGKGCRSALRRHLKGGSSTLRKREAVSSSQSSAAPKLPRRRLRQSLVPIPFRKRFCSQLLWESASIFGARLRRGRRCSRRSTVQTSSKHNPGQRGNGTEHSNRIAHGDKESNRSEFGLRTPQLT